MDCKMLLILDEFLEYEPENKDDYISMFNHKMLESSIRYIKGKEVKNGQGFMGQGTDSRHTEADIQRKKPQGRIGVDGE